MLAIGLDHTRTPRLPGAQAALEGARHREARRRPLPVELRVAPAEVTPHLVEGAAAFLIGAD